MYGVESTAPGRTQGVSSRTRPLAPTRWTSWRLRCRVSPCPRPGSAEAGEAVPDLLQVLRVVAAAAGGVPDDPRVEDAVLGDTGAEFDEFGTPEAGVQAQLLRAQPVSGMPGERAGQETCGGLDGCAPVAGVEDQRLDVSGYLDPSVHLCLDVVVEGVASVRLGLLDEGHPGRDAERGRLGRAVGVAEGGAAQCRTGQPEVRGAEPGCRPDRLATEVEGAVDRALVGRGGVVGPSEDPALPAPPVAAWVGGQPAVARTRDELRAVEAVLGQRLQDRSPAHAPVRVEVQGQPQRGIECGPRGPGRDMAQGPLPRGAPVPCRRGTPEPRPIPVPLRRAFPEIHWFPLMKLDTFDKNLGPLGSVVGTQEDSP